MRKTIIRIMSIIAWVILIDAIINDHTQYHSSVEGYIAGRRARKEMDKQ